MFRNIIYCAARAEEEVLLGGRGLLLTVVSVRVRNRPRSQGMPHKSLNLDSLIIKMIINDIFRLFQVSMHVIQFSMHVILNSLNYRNIGIHLHSLNNIISHLISNHGCAKWEEEGEGAKSAKKPKNLGCLHPCFAVLQRCVISGKRYVQTLRLLGTISCLGVCYIHTKVIKCIREKITLYFPG